MSTRDVSMHTDLARGVRVLTDDAGETWEVCAECLCPASCCICHFDDDERDYDGDEEDDPR